ncbi:amino acid adenylation domain-containing protein [Tumebacillus sp. BK434]|uniref:non-ribosomal peptide synthetase n=1 Tax=Tumebacillus sp. BK434 TaxID=2512169 RepID=UPI0010516BB6|nr:non-ribosomal peptide synthetase [Tumebacillus sp. BK434]TCP59051.1 amino acid adenylation domain-containing protein [Tumebacillus sp. BK434]
MDRKTDLLQRRSNLSADKRALLEKRLRGEIKTAAQTGIAKRESAERAALSFAQARLWFLDRLQPGNPVYNVPSIIKMRGQLRLDVLTRSLNEILSRHEALRTTFRSEGGVPYQAIAEELKLTIPVLDIGEADWRPVARTEAARPFDLEKGPLLRATLLRVAEEEHILLLTLHHIVADGWSLGVLLQEMTALYDAFYHGKHSPLPELPIQYADYAKWQGEQGDLLQRQLSYWKQQLGDNPPALQLATDHPRPVKQSMRGAQKKLPLPDELPARLKELCEQEGVTLFMLLLAAYHVLLHRYTAQEDISIGTPIAGRSRGEMEGLIGLFINSLSLRVQVAGERTFREVLQQVRQVSLDAFANQDVPFEKVVEELQVERSLSQTPLFQAFFRHLPELYTEMHLPELTWLPVPVEVETSMFDLSLTVGDTNGSLSCTLDYSPDLFDGQTIERMLAHYRELLASVVSSPEQPVSALNHIPPVERRTLDLLGKGSEAVWQEGLLVHQIFEAQAASTPDAPAILMGDDSITYAELNERANLLAYRLQAQGIRPGDLVGIRLERSPELIISILGALKAGAGYVPIDPTHPQERQEYILQDAKLSALITESNSMASSSETIMLNPIASIASQPNADKFENPVVRPDHPIYVLYTSGTTGQPKGVVMPHRAIANLICWQLQDARFAAGQRTLQYATVTFDVSVQEIFSTLCSGGTLVLIGEDVRRDPMRMISYLSGQRVERLFLPYVAFQQLAETAEAMPDAQLHLTEIFTAGDQLQLTAPIRSLLQRLPGCTLYNHYGPTESHVVTSYRLPDTAADTLPPIGRPIAGAGVRILDANGRLAPLGVPGELCLGGVCLAEGYLNRHDLTAERFVLHEGQRFYKTGDRARWRPDGNLDYLGRLDHQVKIRGYRIEPGEIESMLRQHPNVLEAAVIPHELTPGDKRLVAYYVKRSEPAPTAGELRAHLQSRLPEYMIPSLFLPLDAMPLNANRKLDRRALPSPAGIRLEAEQTRVAPRSDLERELVQIWEQLLGVTGIGVTDNFFSLGGHSLLAVRLMTQIAARFRQSLPLATLFEGGTVEHLADLLRQERAKRWSPLVGIQPHGTRTPFFCIHAVGGTVFSYSALAQTLGPDQPFYGLQACGLEPEEEPLTSIEEQAAAYLAAIRSVQPQGPYRIGAWSLGGTIAYELAHQLTRQGERVELLALFDSLAPVAEYQMQADSLTLLALFARDLLGGRDPEVPSEAIESEEQALQFLQRQLPFPIELDNLRRLWSVFKANIQAYTKYQPVPYSGDLLLFRSNAAGDPSHGWQQLVTGELQIQHIAADHYGLLQTPHVQTLAAEIAN